MPVTAAITVRSFPARKLILLSKLRQRIGAIERSGTDTDETRTLPFGIAAIDSRLPGGGLPLGCLHEVIGQDNGASAGFCAALLGRLVAHSGGAVLWCLRHSVFHESGSLHAPGLAALGLDPQRLIMVQGRQDTDILWAMEEGLRCTRLAAVLGEIRKIDLTASRRLQLAAEASGVSALLLRSTPAGASSPTDVAPPTAAVTRWRLGAAPVSSSFSKPQWHVELLRCRGGRLGAWSLEWNHETGDLGLATVPCDRPIVPQNAQVAV